MKLFEKTEDGYEEIPQQICVAFDRIPSCQRWDNELRILIPIDEILGIEIHSARLSIIESDLHNNIPCGLLKLLIISSGDLDTIFYFVRFTEKEIDQIKKFFLTGVPK